MTEEARITFGEIKGLLKGITMTLINKHYKGHSKTEDMGKKQLFLAEIAVKVVGCMAK